jgi:hypothetical protein
VTKRRSHEYRLSVSITVVTAGPPFRHLLSKFFNTQGRE